MSDFAERTGLSNPNNPPRRYLWTDAHAVCNFLSLQRETGEVEYLALAAKLIDQVHHVLGKHRSDDTRQGWISGLSEDDGEHHPTAGGLRIGKALNERGPDDPYDERLEWDRDGQYFHYLTKWMHALFCAGRVMQKSQYCRWALELAQVAHAGFARALWPDGRKRLVWKMSIDLSRPLVPSSGLHDPLDAYVTYTELCLCPERADGSSEYPNLSAEIAAVASMNRGQRWATDDPLGIGGLLFDACRVVQLVALGLPGNLQLAATLLGDVRSSLAAFASRNELNQPAAYRLAFRELGLSIGLKAIEKMRRIEKSQANFLGTSASRALEELRPYREVGERIEAFWQNPVHQQASSWREHFDINTVMLATSLLPSEFLSVMDA